MNKVLRLVGGPYDGAVQDVRPDAVIVQMGIPIPEAYTPGMELKETPVNTAIYRRRSMQFADGTEPVEFLCWSEFTDRQAMMWLLRQTEETVKTVN